MYGEIDFPFVSRCVFGNACTVWPSLASSPNDPLFGEPFEKTRGPSVSINGEARALIKVIGPGN